MQEVDLQLKPSRTLLFLCIALFVLAGLSLLVLQQGWAVKAGLLLVLVICGWWSVRSVSLAEPRSITGLRSLQHRREWLVTRKNTQQYKCRHLTARVYRQLVIVELVNPVNQQRHLCYVMADAVSADEHRKLRALVLALEASGND